MSHINYFEPYKSIKKNHEDQLTRSYLVVLRYSPSSLISFHNYCKRNAYSQAERLTAEKNLNVEINIPEISDIDLSKIEFETQKTDLKEYISNTILSVLITAEEFEVEDSVNESERGARYDGIIRFSDDIMFVIENKPYNNVWSEQLNPNLTSIEDTENIELIKAPAVLEWKEIIKQLNNLLTLNSVNGTEKLVITDFIDFVDSNFPFLNPYDNFALCKGYEPLLKRRAGNILKEISKSVDNVNYHSGWQNYYIKTDLDEISYVGLIIKTDESNGWKLRVEMWFGDTVYQSRNLYKNDSVNYETISKIINDGWLFEPNLHLSHIQKHILWFKTANRYKEHYLKYWIDNIDKIGRYSKDELVNNLDSFAKDNIILIDIVKRTELKDGLIDTNRNLINLIPGFGLIYEYSSNDAIKLDKHGIIIEETKNRISAGLSILDKKINFLRLS